MRLAFYLYLCCIPIILFPYQSYAINILVLEEMASPSHHHWIRQITTQLAGMGYNITSLSADIDAEPLENLHYIHLEKVYSTVYPKEKMFDVLFVGSLNALILALGMGYFSVGSCSGALQSIGWQQLKDYPDDFKFDLVLHDFTSGFCHLAFLPKFNYPPVISITALNELLFVGPLVNDVLTPSVSSFYLFKTMPVSFLQRVANYAMQVFDYILREYLYYPMMDKLIRKSGMIVPPFTELRKRTELVLFNHNAIIDLPAQLSANVIAVGGLHIKPVKSLPLDLEYIVNNATKGVILFSLGTNVPIIAVEDEQLSHLLNAFRMFPDYTFLCKFELDNSPVEMPENIVQRKWLPQNDVLAHKNTKLFITHGGLLSTQEAVWHGVPMLGMPVFTDQFQNIERCVQKGVAEQIHWHELTAELLHDKIRMLLENSQYKDNMMIWSGLFRDQKEPALDRAIWWIEWVLRNPNSGHFRGPAYDLNFFQLQSFDVLAVLGIMVLILSWIVTRMLCSLIKSICRYSVSKAKNMLRLKEKRA